jgi:hypothetical protein
MSKYRKKPVVIEAIQFHGSSTAAYDIQQWIAGGDPPKPGGMHTADVVTLKIETLEGTMKAQPGDYIIKGVQGEFYPCKPDIFEATYEAVTDAD